MFARQFGPTSSQPTFGGTHTALLRYQPSTPMQQGCQAAHLLHVDAAPPHAQRSQPWCRLLQPHMCDLSFLRQRG